MDNRIGLGTNKLVVTAYNGMGTATTTYTIIKQGTGSPTGFSYPRLSFRSLSFKDLFCQGGASSHQIYGGSLTERYGMTTD